MKIDFRCIRKKKDHKCYNSDIIYFVAGWLGALSAATALLLSPVTIAFCRRKSTRVTAVLGGLVAALGCLFTSFATQFHQLFFSYALVLGVGVGMTRDTSTLMVAQYFKRRRELVEIFIVAGSGLGLALMSAFIRGAVRAVGWRLGLQAVTCAVFLTFFLGTFYRSASLYHPQRRAILHLKNQKRKVKDKSKPDDKPPFFDVSTLRSLAWALGCAALGLLVVRNSADCRIARQYLCQACAFVSGLAILALTAVQGYRGYLLFVWVYGTFCGGYHYSLKMFTYERVRARNFARTWGFVQCSQALPIALGVPLSGYISEGCGGKAGYYFSSTCVLLGSAALSLIDVHRRRVARHKHTAADGATHTCRVENCPDRYILCSGELKKPELTCISEEGIADMDLPDNLLDDLDYIGDCITSCNKYYFEIFSIIELPNYANHVMLLGHCQVENYLMLSEFENNLIAETPVITDRKGRRWSLQRNPVPRNLAPLVPPAADLEATGAASPPETSAGVTLERRRSREVPPFRSANWRLLSAAPKRPITVIDEASV
ncbi:hypothetical protein B566_EDAN017755 [Ephemera danica]|nr:hypothetical protein B566_EDAN017755 [Ephemera danica]